MIALCSMQALSLDQYLPILRKCDSLFKEGKLSETLMSWTVNPNFSKRHLIVRNYKDPWIQAILTDLSQQSSLSEAFKRQLKSILSDSLWENSKGIKGVQEGTFFTPKFRSPTGYAY